MDEGLRLQAQEWFDRGDHDIETAQLPNEQGDYTDIIAYHIQQAIEKYLMGFLITNTPFLANEGWGLYFSQMNNGGPADFLKPATISGPSRNSWAKMM